MSCRPDHSPRHPDFEPGNDLSLVHGANSPRAIAARAESVHAELLVAAPYLNEERFLPAVSRYLQAAAREALLHDHIVTLSASKGPGAVPSRVWEQATAATRLAAKLGSDLGLDPIGHARIRSLSAGATANEVSIAELQERGREIRAAREARNALTAPQTDPVGDATLVVSPADSAHLYNASGGTLQESRSEVTP